MNNARPYYVFFLVMISGAGAHAQHAERAMAIVDTEISSMVREVSPDSIKAYIARMVSFGTRHSLSDTVDARQGIGAARRWVAAKLSGSRTKIMRTSG